MAESNLIKVSYPANHVAEISICRPEKLNSITYVMFGIIGEWFEKFAVDPDVRVILVTGDEKVFSAGGDIFDLAGGFPYESDDIGRKSIQKERIFSNMTRYYQAIDKCGKPVIAAVSGLCIGSGLELALTADIRYCTKSMKFALKEVTNGITAWMGGVQRIQKIIGWDSWVREILFTGRFVNADESNRVGLFSRVFDTYKEMMDFALETAQTIASKSPVALYGTKTNLNFSRDHSYRQSMEYTAHWNGWAYHTNDLTTSIASQLQKVSPVFPKL